jgi:hypothetical protein
MATINITYHQCFRSIFTESGSRHFAELDPDQSWLSLKRKKKKNLSKKRPIALLKPLQRTLRPQEEASSLIENSSNRTILACLDPDPVSQSGSANTFESGSNPDTDRDPNHFLTFFPMYRYRYTSPMEVGTLTEQYVNRFYLGTQCVGIPSWLKNVLLSGPGLPFLRLNLLH